MTTLGVHVLLFLLFQSMTLVAKYSRAVNLQLPHVAADCQLCFASIHDLVCEVDGN